MPRKTPPAITGDAIRAWREARGLSQKALAALLGMSPTTVARWERGEETPAQPQLLILALEGLDGMDTLGYGFADDTSA